MQNSTIRVCRIRVFRVWARVWDMESRIADFGYGIVGFGYIILMESVYRHNNNLIWPKNMKRGPVTSRHMESGYRNSYWLTYTTYLKTFVDIFNIWVNSYTRVFRVIRGWPCCCPRIVDIVYNVLLLFGLDCCSNCRHSPIIYAAAFGI